MRQRCPCRSITRAEIDKAGVTTAAELIARISASANNLTDGGSIGYGGFRDQMGFNAANLRGLGVSSTLVLLNGRRMANFASPGDAAGVDLNSIPAAAIQRVEILLDGASSLYGSDAIGGVINFITRKDFSGIDISALAGNTTEGHGAAKRSATVAGGFGDFGRDGFNVFGVLDVQKTSSLNASQAASSSRTSTSLAACRTCCPVPPSPANIRSCRRYQLRHAEVDEGFSRPTARRSSIRKHHQPGRRRWLQPAGPTSTCRTASAAWTAAPSTTCGDIELYPKSNKSSIVRPRRVQPGQRPPGCSPRCRWRGPARFYTGTPQPRGRGHRRFARVRAFKGSSLNDAGFGRRAAPDHRCAPVWSEAGLRTSELISTTNRFLVLGTNGMLGRLGL